MMLKSQTIQEKIDKTIEKIKKLELKYNKCALKIDKGDATLVDLRRITYDIDKSKETLSKLQKSLEVELKRESIRIPVVEQFLIDWANKAYAYYLSDYAKLVEYRKQVSQLKKELEKQYGCLVTTNREIAKKYKVDYATVVEYMKDNHSALAIECLTEVDVEKKIKHELNKEVDRKRNNLIEKIMDITGIVTDVTYLTIGVDGGLNGIVHGENGSASVNTIYAGGYNIQVLHYRTLIKRLSK